MFYEDSHCFYQEIIRMKQIEIFHKISHFSFPMGLSPKTQKKDGKKGIPRPF